jgi:CheY-like chemotaxis protein
MKAKPRVIVIDDDPDSLGSVAAALRRDGYAVHPFTDPREGLAYLSSDGADVVLTDLKMPGLSGMEVIGRVIAEHPGCRWWCSPRSEPFTTRWRRCARARRTSSRSGGSLSCAPRCSRR